MQSKNNTISLFFHLAYSFLATKLFDSAFLKTQCRRLWNSIKFDSEEILIILQSHLTSFSWAFGILPTERLSAYISTITVWKAECWKFKKFGRWGCDGWKFVSKKEKWSVHLIHNSQKRLPDGSGLDHWRCLSNILVTCVRNHSQVEVAFSTTSKFTVGSRGIFVHSVTSHLVWIIIWRLICSFTPGINRTSALTATSHLV